MDRLILDTPTLLIAARAVGLAVAAHDGYLVVKGPKGAAGLARLLLERKADVLAAFAAESSAAADSTGPPGDEPPGPVGSDDPGPPSAPAADPAEPAPPTRRSRVPQPQVHTEPSTTCPGVVGPVDRRDIGPDGEWSVDRFFARLREKHGYGGWQAPPKAAETMRQRAERPGLFRDIEEDAP
jgi:hypothetical protein